ncbi:MAG: FHA domain-containing protein [Oculatellaceae cyanobacterium Prado106]|jgi:pSer/pThr/pTyr-binding forkhead associated (FHA) protein|nr:FHA domain-containing protein [Oculatellaceae cyanobacterium Prado106]
MTSSDRFFPNGANAINLFVDEDLQRRLGLYQVFLKLYDHHRGLLDEILGLENSSSPSLANAPYLQGVVQGRSVHLVTNLLQGTTQAIAHPQNTWLIGRDPERVTLALADRRLSRCHAAIHYVEDQGFYLADLDSSNGSFINGERIRKTTLLKDGDRVRLGSLSFTFFLCQSTQTLANPISPELLDQLNHSISSFPFAQATTELDLEVTEGSTLAESPSRTVINPAEETSNFMRPAKEKY